MTSPVKGTDSSSPANVARQLLAQWNAFSPGPWADIPHEHLLTVEDFDLLQLVDFPIPNWVILKRNSPRAKALEDMWAKRRVAQAALAVKELASSDRMIEAERLRNMVLGVADRQAADWVDARVGMSRVVLIAGVVALAAPVLAALVLPMSIWALIGLALSFLVTAGLWTVLLPILRKTPSVAAVLSIASLFASISGVIWSVANLPIIGFWPTATYLASVAVVVNIMTLFFTLRVVDALELSHIKERFPEGAVMYHFLSAYAAARVWAERDPLKPMKLVWHLEDAARRVEFEYARRRGSGDAQVQAYLDRFGSTLGAVVREHKTLALEGSWFGRRRVPRSLLNGLAYLLRFEPAALLVVDPPSPRLSMWDRFGSRIMLMAALIAGGIGLPALLPDLITQPAEFRATAFVTALFTLFSPDPKAASEALRKFSPRNK